MKKAYLLLFSNEFASRDAVKIFANASPLVYTWRYDLPNSFYLISENSAREIAEGLQRAIGNKNRFIVTEINENHWGWLPDDTWYLIKNKSVKPVEPKQPTLSTKK
jgi:hypothetical protein